MHTHPIELNIRFLKTQLCDLIISKNYDLLDSEILFLSRQLDQLILPLFEPQCDSIHAHVFSLNQIPLLQST